MKKFFLNVVVFAFALNTNVKAQSQLMICAGVNEEGNCFLTNSKYITSPGKDEGLFFMMVVNQQGLNTSAIDFKIYNVSKTGEESLAKSMRQEVGADWVFAWKNELFASPGKYKVRIFDSNGNQLDNKMFELVKFQ